MIIKQFSFLLGECGCEQGFVYHYDKNNSLTCHQEFLQGPCAVGEQYVYIEQEFSFEPKCVPTNCDNKNQIRYDEKCINVPKCEDNKVVKFPSDTNGEAKCTTENKIGVRSEMIKSMDSKPCPEGNNYKQDCTGKCRPYPATIGSNKKKGKRSPSKCKLPGYIKSL